MNSVPHLRTNFALRVGLGVFNTETKTQKDKSLGKDINAISLISIKMLK